MNINLAEQIKEAIDNICFTGTFVEDMPWGNGHINDTFLLVFEGENKPKRNEQLPKSMDTIINEATRLIEKEIERYQEYA